MLLISLMDVDLHHLQCSDNKIWYDRNYFIVLVILQNSKYFLY